MNIQEKYENMKVSMKEKNKKKERMHIMNDVVFHSIPLEAITDVTTLIKDYPIYKFNIGLLDYSVEVILDNPELHELVNKSENQLKCYITANCEQYLTSKERLMKVKHFIYFNTIDGYLVRAVVEVQCFCVVYTNRFDDALIHACTRYCQGLINESDLSLLKDDLTLPDFSILENLQSKIFEGYIKSYGEKGTNSSELGLDKDLSINGHNNDIDNTDEKTLCSSLKELVDRDSMIVSVIG